MQLGRLEVMDQGQVDHVSKISKIQESDQKAKVDPEEKYKNATQNVEVADNEVILDNVKFGYNSKTNDFFVFKHIRTIPFCGMTVLISFLSFTENVISGLLSFM